MVDRIDLDRARREAKALLRRWRAEGREARLADAQRAVAAELGEVSWPRLVRRVEAEGVAREQRAERFVEDATRGRLDHADALLALDPGLSARRIDAALVLGDADQLRAWLAGGAMRAERPLGARGWPPLVYVTHSAYLGGERTEGLVACARALLDAGADPNATWTHPEFGAQSTLYGAAGIAHEPRMTALLLAAGANPDDGESVYHATEERPDPRCLRLLLDVGARIAGTNAVAHALDHPDTTALQLLLARLDDPREVRDLLAAAIWRERDADVLRLLAAAGADVEAPDLASGRRPYALAVHLGRPDLAHALAELGAQPEVEPIDALAGAALRGARAEAEALLARDRDLHARLLADHGELLVRAAAECNAAGVGLLHDLGVPLSTRGQLSGTALHHAAWHGWVEGVELLIDRGADVHVTAPETGDMTPLGWTAHGSVHAPRRPAADHHVVAERLVAVGAEVARGLAEEAAGELAAWLAERDGESPRESTPDVRRAATPTHDWSERDHAAQIAHLRALAELPTSETLAVGDGFAVRTAVPSNAENGVVAGAATEEEIAAALAFLRGRSAQWLTPDGALGPRLGAAGARPDRGAWTAGAGVPGLALDGPVPDGIAIGRTAELAAVAAFGTERGWIDPGDEAMWTAVLAAPGLLHHLALDPDGVPVGAAITAVHGDTAALRTLSVAPALRRRGLARALVRAALADAGTPYAIAGLTRSSRAFFARLGFTPAPCPPDRTFYL